MPTRHALPFGTLTLPPLDPACRLTVTIPAKNEAGFITPTLNALRRQATPDGQPIDPRSYEVIVLANNCTDDTAGVVRAYAERFPTFRLHVVERRFPRAIAAVGTARRLLMDTAMVRFEQRGLPCAVIGTTDADTRVDRCWVYHTQDSVRAGARAVGGRILVPAARRTAGVHYRKHHLLDVTYRTLQYCLESMIDPDPADPWPRHFQHFGPSTAVTVAAYRACGGMPPLRSLEDVGLVKALQRVGISVRHNRNVKVYTSDRVSDRVAGTAFSHQLDEWSALTEARHQQRVIGLANCRRLFKWKVSLRYAVHHRIALPQTQLEEMAMALHWSREQLAGRLRDATVYGGLYQEVRERLEACTDFAGTDIQDAVRELRVFTSSLRHRAFGTNPGGTYRPGQRVSG